MLKARMPRWGRMTMSVAPLFPCYLFARLDLQINYFEVKYLAGVTGLVSAGADPLVVPEVIISEIRARGIDDVVEIREVPFDSGQPVRVVEGPFRGFEAIFERYLSSTERVAILLKPSRTSVRASCCRPWQSRSIAKKSRFIRSSIPLSIYRIHTAAIRALFCLCAFSVLACSMLPSNPLSHSGAPRGWTR